MTDNKLFIRVPTPILLQTLGLLILPTLNVDMEDWYYSSMICKISAKDSV